MRFRFTKNGCEILDSQNVSIQSKKIKNFIRNDVSREIIHSKFE